MELRATRGLIDALRSAPHDTVVPVRVVREPERTGATGLRPPIGTADRAAAGDVVSHFSSRAVQLARRSGTAVTTGPTHREPPPRGQRLDVLA